MAEGILVIIEQNKEKVSRIGWEALVGAQKLAAELDTHVSAVLLGSEIESAAGEVAAKDLKEAHTAQNQLLASYTPDGYATTLTQIAKKLDPQYIIVGHSYQARDYVPKLALKIDAAILTDCTGFRVENDTLILTRQIFSGKLGADYTCAGEGPVLISFQAGAFSADDIKSGEGTVSAFDVQLQPDEIRTNVLDIFEGTKKEVDLAKADIIISAGRGLKEEDNIELVQELASALGGEVAASRPVCDDGWLGVDRQVGSSGQTVAPKLYVGVGISGAIQHVVGMKSSKYIIAINKDPFAPIFEIADVAVVADLFDVVPALTKAVNEG